MKEQNCDMPFKNKIFRILNNQVHFSNFHDYTKNGFLLQVT